MLTCIVTSCGKVCTNFFQSLNVFWSSLEHSIWHCTQGWSAGIRVMNIRGIIVRHIKLHCEYSDYGLHKQVSVGCSVQCGGWRVEEPLSAVCHCVCPLLLKSIYFVKETLNSKQYCFCCQGGGGK